MQDLKIETKTNKFKCRVNGIVILNNKILTIKSPNSNSYYLPGGHIEFTEDSKTAALREMNEELQTEVNIKSTFAIIENFYVDRNNLSTHEISFYYAIESKKNLPEDDFQLTENDKGVIKTHFFHWIKLNDLKNTDFRPSILKEKLSNNNLDFEHIILKQ